MVATVNTKASHECSFMSAISGVICVGERQPQGLACIGSSVDKLVSNPAGPQSNLTALLNPVALGCGEVCPCIRVCLWNRQKCLSFPGLLAEYPPPDPLPFLLPSSLPLHVHAAVVGVCTTLQVLLPNRMKQIILQRINTVAANLPVGGKQTGSGHRRTSVALPAGKHLKTYTLQLQE